MGKFDNVKIVSTQAPTGTPTGKFANVKIVNPSQTSQTEQPAEKKDGLLASFAKSIIKHPAEVAVSAYNVAKSTKDLLHGDVAQAGQNISASRNLPFLGETKAAFTGKENTGELLKKQLGYGAEIASTIFTPAKAANVGATGLKTLATQVPKQGLFRSLPGVALQGAKASAPLIPSGIAGSAGYTAAEGGTLPEIAASGVVGGIATPVIGGAAGVVGRAVSPVVRGTLSKLGNKEAQAAQTGIVRQEAGDLMARATDAAAKGQKARVQQKTGQELYQNMVDEQIPLGTQKGTDAVMIDATVAEPVLQKKYDMVDEAIDSHLGARPQQDLSLREIERRAHANIDATIKDPSDAVSLKQEVSNRIEQAIADQRYGRKAVNNGQVDSFLNGQEMRELRSGWGKSKGVNWDKPMVLGANKEMYFAANKLIDDVYQNPMIRELNEQFSKLLTIGEALNPTKAGSLHGKVIKGGGLGQSIRAGATRILGGAVGGSLGSPFGGAGVAGGTMMGQEFAGRLSNALTKRKLSPERLSNKAIGLLRKKGIKSKTDEIIERSSKALKDFQSKPKPLQLPAGATPLGPKTSKSGLFNKNPTILTREPQPKYQLPEKATEPTIALHGEGILSGQQSIKPPVIDGEVINTTQPKGGKLSIDKVKTKNGVLLKKQKTEKPKVTNPLRVVNNKIKVDDSVNRALEEMSYAEAGSRIFTEDGVIGVSSSFPKWIPEELRRKDLLRSVQKHIINDTTPTKYDEVRLYDTILGRVGQYVDKNPRKILDVNDLVFGGIAGMETYEDENGNIKVRYNPEKGAAGVAFMAGVTNPKVKGILSKASKLKGATDDLLKEAKKYKSAEEFVNSQSLYHGTPNELEGGMLKFGAGKQLKKGGYMGGHFLTDTPDIANNFSFGGKVYQASGEIKNKVLDVNKNKKLFENYVGKEYLSDGEKVKFTKQDFEYMFPNGKADWSTINTDLLEQVAKKQGKIGVAIPEYAGGKEGMTYQIFEDNIPVYTKSQLEQIWKEAQGKTKTGGIEAFAVAPVMLPVISDKKEDNVSTTPSFNVSKDSKIKAIAAIFAEAAGESKKGKQAVINSIQNRLKNPKRWGKDVFEVVSDGNGTQYNGFDASNPLYTKVRDYLRGKDVKLNAQEKASLNELVELYDKAQKGKLEDITKGSTHYLNKKTAKAKWQENPLSEIGIENHTFYRPRNP